MGKRTRMPEHEANLLLTSGLILVICLILAAVAYFAFRLEILDPPGTSDAPSRVGVSDAENSGLATPDGSGQADLPHQQEQVETIILFPGFVDFSITNGVDTVSLYNDSANTVTLSFTLTDEDSQVVFSTAPLQPGQSEDWKVTDTFDPGTGSRKITVTIDAQRISDGEEMTGIVSEFTVDMG